MQGGIEAAFKALHNEILEQLNRILSHHIHRRDFGLLPNR
ncbi:hypothetical protein SynBIOSE41_02826 [Synechococcus sp. BIOS-E4-1]|nr:hypothetical protein SynBIOSE41_02826 [Synechococcus sp. BIOS-E4-1]